MNFLIVLPIIAPLVFAILTIAFNRFVKIQRNIHIFGTFFVLVISVLLLLDVRTNGIQAYFVGNWKAPFGISIVADLFSAIMVVIASIISFASAIYSIHTIDSDRENYGYYPLLNTLMMGINGSFLTGDIFNLYVWFEVMLISSFVLLALGSGKKQLEGAIKYVTLNLLSSAFFLAATGLLYGTLGTLNMADLARKVPMLSNTSIINVIAVLYLIAFGIKSAIFPLFFWLPASYHTPPAVISALFAGLLTKVGVYALVRVFTLIFISNVSYTHSIILILSGFTMITGVLGAAAQTEFRKILSFHIVSQIGYMIMGLGLFTQLAIAGTVFYLIHHIIVKTNLFFISGLVNKSQGSYKLKELGGLYKVYPLLGLLFLIPAFSLAGIPPLSGFWSKLILVKAGLDINQFLIVIVSLVTSILTLYSMTKIWNEVFWKDKKSSAEEIDSTRPLSLLSKNEKIGIFFPIIFLAVLTIIIGLFVQPFFELANSAAIQLMNKEEYIKAVLGL